MRSDWVDHARRWIPRPVRYWLQRFVSLDDVKLRWRARRHPLSGVTEGNGAGSAGAPLIGILRNRAQYHVQYVAACQELGLPFRVIDLFASDWLSAVRSSGCNVFFTWPDATQRPMATLFKDRCDLLEAMGIVVVPSRLERWLYEDKYRQRDWLMANGIAHPRTWIFTDRKSATDFAGNCDLPIVYKTSFGGAATGVSIIRSRSELLACISRAFGKGHITAGHDRRDRDWGRIFLQEYHTVMREWRMVRIGDSYFGHPKGRAGDFHSGSGRVQWDIPNNRLLDLLHEVTEVGKFRSMDVDIFETDQGHYLVNELQTVFGASTSIDQMRADGEPGRMVRSEAGGWQFEAGDYARNACANARIEDYLQPGGFRSL